MEDILHISTFKRVTLFLVETAQKEIMYGDKPELIRYKGRAGDFKKTLLDEMKRYARQQYPFNQRFDENRAIISWWEALQGSEHARILPVSRIMSRIQHEKTFTKPNAHDIRFLQSKYLPFVSIPCQRNALYPPLHG
jgi:hypothetical protein